jgi:peptidoglycan/xylan/chitin deacetylase (PgdA/CDA1 family)
MPIRKTPTYVGRNWNAWYKRMRWGEVFWWSLFLLFAIAIVLIIVRKSSADDKRIPIIVYHHISKGNDNYHLKPEIFRDHLNWLKSTGYETVTFKDVWELGPKLPKKPIILTFDDGSKDHWNVYKELKSREMKGVFFIVTGYMGLKPNQLIEMDKNGMEIGSHTVHHKYLTSLMLADFYEEVNGSQYTLQKMLGHKILTLAYPYGSYDQKVISLMRESTYTYARTTDEYITKWGSERNFRLPVVLIRKNTRLLRID